MLSCAKKVLIMGERIEETEHIDEMKRHKPVYPLPMEIQQMEQSETVCQYCGVSYLILHEFQRLQERLQAVERELEAQRGAAERETVLREELQEASAHLAQLRAAQLEQAERVEGLGLQLLESQAQLEAVRAERTVMEQEVGKAWGCCQQLRGRSQLQVQALRDALSMLRSCRQDLHDVRQSHVHVSTEWEECKAQVLQTCQHANAEGAKLWRGLVEVQGEAANLREVQRRLEERLATSDIRTQELQNRAQNQEELQARNTKVQEQLQELKEKVTSLLLDLQESRSERERLESLLQNTSKEKEKLHSRHVQLEKEQRQIHSRLSEDLRDREEKWLSCQQECQSMQEELGVLERWKEEVTQKHVQTDGENRALRRSLQLAQQEITTLKEDSERAALSHGHSVQQLEERFRQQQTEALEQRTQAEALVQRERAQLGLQLKEREQMLRAEAQMELQIEREKNREVVQEYQREAKQLQEKLPSMVQAATQELRVELATMEEKLREAQEGRAEREQHLQRTASELEQQLLRVRGDGQRGALQLAELREELQQMRQETGVLQQENALLQETVRRECEERGELTAALTLAREQLLDLRRTPPHSGQGPYHIPGPGGPCSSKDSWTKGAERRSRGRGEVSWHGSGGRAGPPVTLPRLPQERTTSVGLARQRISLVMGRKERS